MNTIINKKKVTAVVHNGVFHTDDVICISLLRYYYGKENVTVVRSRNPKDFENADYILDVGGKLKISDNQVWLDHHQDTATYENGIRRSACGYLYEYLYLMRADVFPFKFVESFRSKILYPVEADDNGQDIKDLNLMPNLFKFVSVLNPDWKSNSNGDQEFLIAVDMADKIIGNVIERLKSTAEAEELTLQAIFKTESSIIELDRYCPWYNVVIDYNENNSTNRKILFVIWRGKDNSYMAQAVAKTVNTRETWLSFPENLRGKTAEEINSISNTTSAVFVHQTGFLGAWKNKEELYKVLNNIIEGNIK